jgi:hypothetical protein
LRVNAEDEIPLALTGLMFFHARKEIPLIAKSHPLLLLQSHLLQISAVICCLYINILLQLPSEIKISINCNRKDGNDGNGYDEWMRTLCV